MQHAHLRGSFGWVREVFCLMGRKNQSVRSRLRGRVCVCVWVGVGHAHLPSPDLARGTGRMGAAKAAAIHAIFVAYPSGLTKGRLECGDLWSAVLPFGPNHDGPHLWLSARGRVSSTGFQPGCPFHQQALWSWNSD